MCFKPTNPPFPLCFPSRKSRVSGRRWWSTCQEERKEKRSCCPFCLRNFAKLQQTGKAESKHSPHVPLQPPSAGCAGASYRSQTITLQDSSGTSFQVASTTEKPSSGSLHLMHTVLESLPESTRVLRAPD